MTILLSDVALRRVKLCGHCVKSARSVGPDLDIPLALASDNDIPARHAERIA